MRKILFILSLMAIIYTLYSNSTTLVIPDAAIRMRVLANSNSEYDQNIKGLVKDKVQENMYSLLKNTTTIDEARDIIKTNLSSLDKTVSKTLEEQNYNLGYSIDFGNHYFPSKEYKGIKYKEGNYESLLITLGAGKGDNWWCVLFPPLCLLEADESTDVEYQFYVKKLIDKFF